MATFSVTNSRGTTYYLYQKSGVNLKGASESRTIYFFAKDPNRKLGEGEAVVPELPAGHKVGESARNGFVYLQKDK
jgi:hypothetical protein